MSFSPLKVISKTGASKMIWSVRYTVYDDDTIQSVSCHSMQVRLCVRDVTHIDGAKQTIQ